jgi:ABC-type transport system involved in cytochrome c biogenesis permease component
MSDFVAAVVGGILFGIAARILMRAAALINGDVPGFNLGASAMIVGVFTLAPMATYLGALIARTRPRAGSLLAVVLTLPLYVPGVSIALVETSEHASLSLAGFASTAIAVIIVACLATSSLLGWRIGRRRRA